MSSGNISTNAPSKTQGITGNNVANSAERSLLETEAVSDKKSILLQFDDASENTGSDINKKITVLDSDLAQLRAELEIINSSVEEGLDRLGDTDTDLTAKVSETYKRLGEIDNAYKSLLKISSRIDVDIQKLNGDVSQVAQVSASGIKSLEKSSIAQSTEFTYKNQQIVTRVSQLVENSKTSGELLNQKIQLTTDSILQIERQLVADIQRLSLATQDKTNKLDDSSEANKARILKLQSVDEAIIKRATILEISSAELSVKSKSLLSATNELEKSTKNLSTELSELQGKTKALEETTETHGLLISNLQSASTDTVRDMGILSHRENKRFKFFIAGFIVLITAASILFITQNEKMSVESDHRIQRNNIVNEEISGLQQAQIKAVASNVDSLRALENKVTSLNTNLNERLTAGMQDVSSREKVAEDKMQKMQDKLQSVEGRFNNNSAFSQIANDNIIHGAQWISSQNKENYTLLIATVDDRQQLYALAQRYNYYLKDRLSYFSISKNGHTKFVLLSGSYSSQRQAIAKLNVLPGFIEMRRPVLLTFSDIQKHIVQ